MLSLHDALRILKVAADRAVLIDRDDIGATVTGPLRFVSDGSGGTISGDVAVNESRYRLGRATAATAVPQLNIKEINLPGGGEEDEAPTRPRRSEELRVGKECVRTCSCRGSPYH